jgi:hypothetical protein
VKTLVTVAFALIGGHASAPKWLERGGKTAKEAKVVGALRDRGSDAIAPIAYRDRSSSMGSPKPLNVSQDCKLLVP